MPDRLENVLRKSGPLLAAAVCVWGAGTFADDLPESVRARALQELRVLDRTPASKPAPAASSRSATAPRTHVAPSVAKPSAEKASEPTRSTAAPAPAVVAEPSPAMTASPVHHEEPSAATKEIEITPTIRPARPTIVRPPIRSRPANSNPWAELANPESASATTGPKDEQDPAGSRQSEQLPAPAASPFAEVAGDRPAATAETANPFDHAAESDEWRPAGSTPAEKFASPEVKPAAPEVAAPETRTADPANRKQNSETTSQIASSNKPKSEQIGADRPVSVLDFLANNVGEPTASADAIKTAEAPARSPSADLSTPRSETIEHESSAVIANGLPRSIRNESSSQHPLESIPDADARLSTPPSDDVAIHEAPRTEQQKLDARNGRDGFMGFCPVTLRDRKTLVDGNPEFTSSYANERFEFASAEAKAAFDSDPARYSPAHAGRDIVLAAGHIDVPGSLRHATYYKNRLYLFRSEQTCRLFEADPARYVVEEDGR